jgi:lysophospholipase L1-like esterase
VPLTNHDELVETPKASATQYRPLLKQFAARLCVAVTIGVFLMAVVELCAYVRYAHLGGGDTLEPAFRLDQAENGTPQGREYQKEFNQSNKVVYHQFVLWRRAPYQGELISINPDGVRRTLHTQCDNRNLTIWTFGDSVMWGGGTVDGDTIPSLIAQDFEKSGTPACVVNYAEKGWSNSQEMIALIELLKHAAHKPDVVLFYDGGSEAFAAYQNRAADTHSNYNSFKTFLDSWGTAHQAGFAYLRQTNTYRLLEKIAAKEPFREKGGQKPPKLDVDMLSSMVVENYIENINIIELLAKQYGFRPVFAWYPNLAVGNKPLTPFEQQALRATDAEFPNMRSMYEAVYGKAGEINSPDFYNLANAVDQQTSSLYLDFTHMNHAGHQIMADRLFDILQHPAHSNPPVSAADISKKR